MIVSKWKKILAGSLTSFLIVSGCFIPFIGNDLRANESAQALDGIPLNSQNIDTSSRQNLTGDETNKKALDPLGNSGPDLSCEEKPIVVIIPSYQNKDFFEKNLDSVLSQQYQNYRVIYIDDASPDGTGGLVDDYVKEKKQGHRFTLIKNTERSGSLANIYKAALLCKPQEIIVNLDGDDWFAHKTVLRHLNKIYADPDVWVTYGQFEHYPCGSPGFAAQVPERIIALNAFRQYSWITTALRTFYAGLFQKIKKDDLLFEGKFFSTAGDLAYMWPIVEMAGTHSRFIPEVLYIYNVTTPIRDIVVNPELQNRMGEIIRTRDKYQPIQSPF